MAVAAELLGVPGEIIPAARPPSRGTSRASGRTCAARPPRRSRWATCSTRPGLDEDIAELWQDIRDAAVGVAAGLGRPDVRLPHAAPLTEPRRTEIRQALGVLDAVFLGEPGVLEARQRIAVRMRAAASHDELVGQRRGTWPPPRASAAAVDRGAEARCAAPPRPARARGPARRGSLRLERGMAAVRLAARGGARYASQRAPAVRQRGRAPAAAAQRPGAADRRGRRRSPWAR